MSTVTAGTEASSRAFALRDDIHIKLAQAKGVCRVIHGAEDMAVIGDRAIKDSLWVVDELLDAAKKAVDELCETVIKPSK